MTVNDRLRAGTYGPTFRRGRIVYAELASVERFAGVTFTDKLIEDTCQGKTDRFIIIKTEHRRVSKWKPIKSLPRKPLTEQGYGPDVLLFVDGEIGFGCWDRDFDKPYVEFTESHRGDPTHWQPLPKPPTQ